MINDKETLLSKKQRILLEIAREVNNPEGFDANAVARKIYSSSAPQNADAAVRTLYKLGFIKPISINHWIYTKFEKDNTAQKKLEVKPQLAEEY